MPAPTIPQVQIGADPQRALASLTSSVQNALTQMTSGNISDGVLLSNVPMAFLQSNGRTLNGAAPTALVHKLGRPANGWICVGLSQPSNFTDSGAVNKAPNTQVLISHTMLPEMPATASFWVF